MDMHRLIFGPPDPRTVTQQLQDAWTQARTGLNPVAVRSATEAYGIGYGHGLGGYAPVVPPPPEWALPQPERTGLMARLLGPAAPKVPAATEISRIQQYLSTGETPDVQAATQAGYYSGWLHGQQRAQPQVDVNLTTMQRLRLRIG